ncbi:conserved hypothetical protein [Ricinus communis]|uniref:Uncharacterized protein n=1 Tax=Ricinus communis TaxID=3988 RepID=B9RPF1_RICCO|nr:conserved hypothetical protein [Ricinus communis]
MPEIFPRNRGRPLKGDKSNAGASNKQGAPMTAQPRIRKPRKKVNAVTTNEFRERMQTSQGVNYITGGFATATAARAIPPLAQPPATPTQSAPTARQGSSQPLARCLFPS